MKQSILITGVGGSGKSTLARFFQSHDYEAYDLEEMPGMFAMINQKTGKENPNYSNDDIEMIKNHDWLLNREHLTELIHNQKADLAFYSGVAANHDDIVDLFSKVIVLVITPETMVERLKSRGPGEYGHTKEAVDHQLSWKDQWEQRVQELGAIKLAADGPVDEVAENIISLL